MKCKLLILVMAMMFVGCDTPDVKEKEGPLGRELRYSFTTEGEEGIHMEVFLPSEELSTGVAIIDCPGGAYYKFCGAFEGTYWAEHFNAIGCAYAVLYYTFPKGDPAVPRHDLERAVGIFLENAVNWGIDKRRIGVMGFSAGGHLASTVATHPSKSWKPGFQILFYPVITMGTGTHTRSRQELLGENPSQALIEEFSNELHVTGDTPKCFLTYASNDTSVSPKYNSEAYYKALVENGVEVQRVVYPSGGHGWTVDSFAYAKDISNKLIEWVSNL